ncbi:MAG: DUF167 domain-containing protein [Desulfobacterales bacterium]|nr:DUF167 domain-containing protein [Desulfobacterales bacterium]
MPLEISESTDGLVFAILVQPRASKNEAVGLYGSAVKIRLTAPPVEGKANKMCAAFLAKSLGVPKSAVEIVSGHTGRTKQVKIACPPEEQAQMRRRILALAG